MKFGKIRKIGGGFIRKALFVSAMLGAIFWPFAYSNASTLSELEKQAAELDRQIKQTQTNLSNKKKQINNIQDMIDNIQEQMSSTQRQIDLQTQKINILTQEIADLNNQIAIKQAELDTKKSDLAEALRTQYEQGNTSTWEVLLGSNSISEAVSKQQYLEMMSANIDTAMTAIKQIQTDLTNNKNQLQTQQNDLVAAKNSLNDKKKSLSNQQRTQQSLLAKSAAEQAQFQSDLAAQLEQKSDVSAEIYALRRAQGGYRTGSTAYPFANSTPDRPDYWGFLTRECTSYVAWYWNDILDKSWYNTRPGSGSAWNWPALASDQGYSVSSTPRVGAIASWNRGGIYGSYGHVAIVEAVNANGTINVSEFNWVPFAYDERYNVSPSGARFIY